MTMYVSSPMIEMLAWQVVQSVNILEDACCPICCGPCSELLKVLNDPGLLEELNDILAECEYVAEGGWDFWNFKKERLRVNKIKKLWFKKDGSHRLVCMSSKGIDQSDQLHQAIEEAEAGFEPGRLKKRYVTR